MNTEFKHTEAHMEAGPVSAGRGVEKNEMPDTWQDHMAYGSERFESVTANNHNIVLFGEGPGIQKIVLGKDVALVLPADPDMLDIHAPYPTHQEAWLPMWFVLLHHSQHKTDAERAYREAVNARVTPEDRDLVRKALIHKAHEFWGEYKDDNTDKPPRKKYKQFTRILQDVLLYVNAPEYVVENQQEYLESHELYPLIKTANALRRGESLEKVDDMERSIESVLSSYSDGFGKEEIKHAYDTLTEDLANRSDGAMVTLMPEKSIEDAIKTAELLRYDLSIAEDDHDHDVISIVSGRVRPMFYQIDTKFGSQLSRERRMDIIAVPENLGPWDVVEEGKQSYQPIGMIVATHTTARTEKGKRIQAQMQEAFTPDMIARHYLGAAQEFLHGVAWGKSFVERIEKDGVSQIKKAIPLYRVASDLLPRAIYMRKTGEYPAGVSNNDLFETGEVSKESQVIEKIFEDQIATQEELYSLYASVRDVFDRWFEPSDYDFFLENMKRMGKEGQ